MKLTFDYQLPEDFPSWRHPPGHGITSFKPGEAIWLAMTDFFESKGYTLWGNVYWALLSAPTTDVVPTGFMYAMHHCGFGNTPGSVADILEYQYIVRNFLRNRAFEP